ncbi:MAG: TatD family hydrolase [Sphingobacteriaceae bacterium]
MILTDTHTHLYYETDGEKRKDLMQRCLNNHVSRLFLPNVNADSISLVYDLVKTYPENCFPMLGLHPCEVKDNWLGAWEKIKEAQLTNALFAVGEIGIDLYWDKTFLNEQQHAFREQIIWAKSLNLPIVIHCRDAFEEVYAILLQEKDDQLRGIFHCFTGTAEQAHQIIELGFYLGIGGVVTYKNSGLDKVLSQISLAHIVLETDSPYLTPVPYRGKPNESSYLIYIAQKVADIYQLELSAVAQMTTQNAINVFGI